MFRAHQALAVALPLALALPAAATPLAATVEQDGFVSWRGQRHSLESLPAELPERARGELAQWSSWCEEHGYVATLDDSATVFLLTPADLPELDELAERATRTLAAFDELLPAPERSPDETFREADWGVGDAVPDRDPVVLVITHTMPQYDAVLDRLQKASPYLTGWLETKRGGPAFVSPRNRAGAVLAQPDGFELETVWRMDNEVVHRLARLLLYRRFGELPHWLEVSVGWQVEFAVQGDLYSFPGRQEFVSVDEHEGWTKELKAAFKKRRKQPLELDELATWKRGTWSLRHAKLAWGLTRFLAGHPDAPLAQIAEDLRLDRKAHGVITHADGSWEIVPGYEAPLETQAAILASRAGESYLAEATEFFRRGKR